jgi:hypothetical protein
MMEWIAAALVACNGGIGGERKRYGAAVRAECEAPLRSNG